LAARVGEAVTDAYHYLREGQVEHGTARLALLIGALEQHVLDDAKWTYRAESLLGMAPVPSQRYQSFEKPQKGKLGGMAQLADPMRASTALAVYRDTHPE